MDNSTFTLVLVIVLLIFALAYYDLRRKKNFLTKNVKNIPIAPYLPWIGFMHLVLNVLKCSYKMIDKGMKVTGSDHFIIFNFHMPVYVTANADDFQIILPNVLEKGVGYEFIGDFLMSDFLLVSKVSKWKPIRKLISKGFKQSLLNKMVPGINKEVVEHLHSFSGKKSAVVLFDENAKFALNSFLRSFAPGCQDFVKNTTVNIYEAMKIFVRTPIERVCRPWLYPKRLYNLSSLRKTAMEINHITSRLISDAIDLTKGKILDECSEESSDMLVNYIKEGIEDDVIVAEGRFLTGAATDTTGLTLTMVLVALGIHPEIQEKVLEEVLEIVGPTDSINHAQVQELKYTEMVIKETMRLFPAVPFIMRKTTDIIHLGEGKIIPKDMEIALGIYNIHRSEKYWKNPLEFDPYRFLPEEVEKRHPFAYVPFSAGPRNCVGFKFAMTVLVIAVALVVREFKIGCSYKSLMDVQLRSFITLEIEDKNRSCSFTRRSGSFK